MLRRRSQTIQFLLQVFFTGLLLGLFRSVIPALSEDEFNIPRDSYLLLTSFVIAFGIVKSAFNLAVGKWANKYGRKPMLLTGWLTAIPIPVLLFYAQNWVWLVAATILLGVQQGLCWSISQISKLDINPHHRHGFIMGSNEFMGYGGVALGGYLSSELAILLNVQDSLLMFGALIIAVAIAMAMLLCEETMLDAASAEDLKKAVMRNHGKLFTAISFKNRETSTICAAGMIEKFIDVLVWVVFPTYLYRKGVPLPLIGMITGAYAFAWGGTQLLSGILADHVSLKRLINSGNVLCGIGACVIWLSDSTEWWFVNSILIGLGMGLLYPTLGTAMSLLSAPVLRAPMMGIYRFWRDFGYAVGSAAVGIGALLLGDLQPMFIFVGVSMLATALLVHVGYSGNTRQVVEV